MKRITAIDVHQGIQHLYEQGLIFGQRFVYVRGKDGKTGVEEKINLFLNWVPVFDTEEIPDKAPRWIPIRTQSNGDNVIQESHHGATAFAIMQLKNFYSMNSLPTEPRSTYWGPKTDFIFIIEELSWHITILRNNRWELFSKPISEPAKRYWTKGEHSLDEYKNSLDPFSELAKWLP